MRNRSSRLLRCYQCRCLTSAYQAPASARPLSRRCRAAAGRRGQGGRTGRRGDRGGDPSLDPEAGLKVDLVKILFNFFVQVVVAILSSRLSWINLRAIMTLESV